MLSKLESEENNGFNRYMVECEFENTLRQRLNVVSFNRYMVECEFISANYAFSDHGVLIDTWWNVNVREIEHNLIRYGGFNRYMVECE